MATEATRATGGANEATDGEDEGEIVAEAARGGGSTVGERGLLREAERSHKMVRANKQKQHDAQC